MRNSQPKAKFPLHDLSLYFDTVNKDRLDRGGLCRKSSELLDLRERMLGLDQATFDTLIRGFRKMVDEARAAQGPETEGAAATAESRRQLYDEVRDVARGSSNKVDAVS